MGLRFLIEFLGELLQAEESLRRGNDKVLSVVGVGVGEFLLEVEFGENLEELLVKLGIGGIGFNLRCDFCVAVQQFLLHCAAFQQRRRRRGEGESRDSLVAFVRSASGLENGETGAVLQGDRCIRQGELSSTATTLQHAELTEIECVRRWRMSRSRRPLAVSVRVLASPVDSD